MILDVEMMLHFDYLKNLKKIHKNQILLLLIVLYGILGNIEISSYQVEIIPNSRYGANGEADFKINLPLFFDDLRAATSPTTIILWLTALPISAEPNAAVFDEKCIHLNVFIKELKCFFIISDRPENKYWRTQFLHTNAFSAELAKTKNCEVLDVHYLFRQDPDMRDTDGCHWNSTGHRIITSYMLEHFILKLVLKFRFSLVLKLYLLFGMYLI
jgi:hypothetical protein